MWSEGGGESPRGLIVNYSAQTTTPFSLLIVESGATWPSWTAELRDRADSLKVEQQAPGESDEQFVQRMATLLSSAQQSGQILETACYVCSLHASRVRDELLKMLAASLQDCASGELILAAGAWRLAGREGKARQKLLALWSELSMGAGARTVSLRFESGGASGDLPAAPAGALRRALGTARRRGALG